MRRTLLVLATLALGGCASSLAVLRPGFEPKGPPAYVDHVDGYAFGWLGEGRFDLGRACVDQTPVAVRQGLTVVDAAFTLLSLGIYAPTTIKVWCE